MNLRANNYIKLRSKGSHQIWENLMNPASRLIVFRQGEKVIPAAHITSNLKTMKLSWIDLERFLTK